MARFMVKASEFKNVCKAVNDRKLAELKKEIIEILKKQDEKEFKKAVDLFESQEMHYSHLEKSITGKWVEKAGYGVGTVRIWKGKKYKKIAPGKWARVFDKEGRGTNIAIGKLIAKVQKIDNVEDLMALVMANKQRFVDENGVDLPVLDKLRAAVDAKNGNVGSKGSSPKTEKKPEKNSGEKYDDGYKVISEDETFKKKLKNGEMTLESLQEVHKQGVENGHETQEYADGVIQAAKDILKETSKPAENTGKVDDYKKQLEDVVKKELVNQKEDVARLYEIKDRGWSGKHAIGLDLTEKDKNTSIEDRIQEAAEWLEKHPDGKAETIGRMLARVELAKEFEKDPDWRFGKKEKPAEKKEDDSKAYEGKLATQKQVDEATEISNKYELPRNEMLKKPISTIQKYANSKVEDFEGGIDKFIEYMAEGRSEGVSMDEVGKEFAKLINHNVARKIWDDYKSGALVPDDKGILKPKEESEAEKHQNRSDAMKGNQNAYKGGSKEESKQKTLSEKIRVSEELSNNHQKAVEKVIEEVKKELGAEKTERGLTYKNSYSGDFKNYKGGDLGRSYHSMINGASKVEPDYNGKPINYLTHDIEWSNSKNIDEYIDKLQERYDKKLKERKEHGIWNTNHAYWGEILEDAIKLQALKDIRDNGLLLTKEEINSYEDEIKAESERKEKESKRINTVIDYYEEESETNPNLDKKELVKIYDAIENGKDTSKFNQHDVEGMAAFMGVDLKKVKKSFDDQFLLDMTVEDEIKELEEEQKEESLFDDYSAEQPELFNSTAMKVREAFNRCNAL